MSKAVARLIYWVFSALDEIARLRVFIQVIKILILQMPNKLYA